MFAKFNKFLMVGVVNTVTTYLIYLFFNFFFAYSLAYTIAYICGIAISYFLNTAWTFATGMSLQSAVIYPAVYVAQYIIGVLSLHWFITSLKVDEKYSAPDGCNIDVTDNIYTFQMDTNNKKELKLINFLPLNGVPLSYGIFQGFAGVLHEHIGIAHARLSTLVGSFEQVQGDMLPIVCWCF